MVEKSITNSIKYGRDQEVRLWLDTHRDPKRISQLLLNAAHNPNQNGKIIEMLLASGADPNYVDETSNCYPYGPSLKVAANFGSLETIKLLIKGGADLNYCAKGNYTIINSAAYNHTCHVQAIVEYLVSLKIDLDTESNDKESALSVLSRRGCFDIVKILLDAGANPTYLGWDDLMFAIVYGTVDECRKLLDTGASIKNQDRLWERTPFLLSIIVGDIEKAELLLHHGASLEETGRCDRPALMYALPRDNSKMLEWLITRGCNIQRTDQFDHTLLEEAAKTGAYNCVEVLLKQCADGKGSTEIYDEAISWASNIKTVRLLKEAGANITRVGVNVYHLLSGTAEDSHFEFVRQLLELFPLPDIPSLTAGGWMNVFLWKTALFLAVSDDDIDIMKLLLDNGANPNSLDMDRYTPLHRVKSAEAAHVLMLAGADPYIKDDCDRTPIDKASDESIKMILLGKTP